MPFLQSSGAISINDIKNLFGGPGSPSLANYYRGGSYIPATKAVPVYEPTSGDYFSLAVFDPKYYWTYDPTTLSISWASSTIYNGPGGSGTTSYTSGGYTYYRGSYRSYDGYTGTYFYGIYRSYPTSVSINTGIPSSGTISLSQFYGAEKP